MIMTLIERKIWIMRCFAFLCSKMGAVVDGIQVLWWPIIQVFKLLSQVVSRKPEDILSGYMSRHRGLHKNYSGADD